MHAEQKEFSEESEKCSICLEPLLKKTKIGISFCEPVPHIFHESCLRKWLEGDNKTCPNCRTDIKGYIIYSKDSDEEFTMSEALRSIGYSYVAGKVVQQDDKEALKFFLRSAAMGNAKAKFDAAGFYYLGKGCVKNRNEAFRLLEEAAAQGHQRSKDRLSSLKSGDSGCSVQ